MKTNWPARALDLHRLTQTGGGLQEVTPLADLPRVLQACLNPPELAERTCPWSLKGETRQIAGQSQSWLHLSAQVTLRQQCQRCLEPLDVHVEVDRWFRLVADEATALAEDDAAEEDLLAMDQELDAYALLEDDILLAMPLVPRHEDCHAPLSTALDDDLPHPFAVLAALKPPKQ